MDSRTDILFARYFSGEATEEELRELDNLLAGSAENEAYFLEMSKLYEQTASITSMLQPNTKKAISNFKNYIGEKQTIHFTRKHHSFFSKYAAVAAVVALLVGLFFLFVANDKTDVTAVNIKTTNAKTITILDHIQVNLSSGAELTYQKESPDKPELKGKATFSIAQKTDKQLIVKAGDTYIRDIGTVFTIDATASTDSVSVSVSKGEVVFYTQNNRGIKLEKGEAGVYYTKKDEFRYLTKNQDTDLIFKNKTLAEIIPLLESKYGVKIQLEPETLSELQINSSFASNVSVEEILHVMAETLSLHIEKKTSNEYTLSAKK